MMRGTEMLVVEMLRKKRRRVPLAQRATGCLLPLYSLRVACGLLRHGTVIQTLPESLYVGRLAQFAERPMFHEAHALS